MIKARIRLKRGDDNELKRNLRLEKVVASKQLRLAVETDRRRKKNKTRSFSEKLATMLIIQT